MFNSLSLLTLDMAMMHVKQHSMDFFSSSNVFGCMRQMWLYLDHHSFQMMDSEEREMTLFFYDRDKSLSGVDSTGAFLGTQVSVAFLSIHYNHFYTFSHLFDPTGERKKKIKYMWIQSTQRDFGLHSRQNNVCYLFCCDSRPD